MKNYNITINNKIILLLFSLIFIVACNDTSVITPEPIKFGKLQKDTINKRENLILLGENMGIRPAGMKILIDSNYVLGLDSIKVWNNSKIEIIPPKFTGKHQLRILTEKDTSPVYTYYLNEVRNIDFKLVVADSFLMGDNNGLVNERPAHMVKIPKDFYASIYEVSQAVYIDVCDANPSITKGDNLPVHNIDWIDAVIFCNKLSKIKGLSLYYKIINDIVSIDTNSNGFRLPTEAEWEFMCRAGSKGDFNVDKNPNEFAWYNLNSGFQLKESGKLLPNAFGLYDMHGNLWEWCWDYYADDYYKSSPKLNPLGPNTGKNRVLRGACYSSGSTDLRSSSRNQPEDKKSKTGIRIIRNK